MSWSGGGGGPTLCPASCRYLATTGQRLCCLDLDLNFVLVTSRGWSGVLLLPPRSGTVLRSKTGYTAAIASFSY